MWHLISDTYLSCAITQKHSLHLRMNQQYELIRLIDVNSHVLFSGFSLVLKPLHISKTCPSCHSNSEVGNVACWSHISSHAWSPLSCSDRSLQCVWCTSLHSTVSFGNWLLRSPLSHPLHGLFASTPNYRLRLPNGPRSLTLGEGMGGSRWVAYESRCIWWRVVLLLVVGNQRWIGGTWIYLHASAWRPYNVWHQWIKWLMPPWEQQSQVFTHHNRDTVPSCQCNQLANHTS